MIALLIGTSLAVLVFSALGLVDGIKGFMSLNWLFVIPVGGLAVGAGVGAIQGYTCFFMNAHLKKHLIFIACMGAAFAYISPDIARYYTETIDITPAIATQIPPGQYKVSDIVPLSAYFKAALSGSSYTYRGNSKIMELGAVGTWGYFIANTIGAMLGAFGFLAWFIGRYPVCQLCNKYLRGLSAVSIYFRTKEAIGDFYKAVSEAVEKTDASGLQNLYINSGAETKAAAADTLFRSTLEARGCRGCGSALLISTASVKKQDWEDIDGLKISIPTQIASLVSGLAIKGSSVSK